jgi:flagellar motor switch protein FliG
MSLFPGKERAAILLSKLPAVTAERLLSHLNPQHSNRLRAEMTRLAQHPEIEKLLDQVLRDFEVALRNPARESAKKPLSSETPTTANNGAANGKASSEPPQLKIADPSRSSSESNGARADAPAPSAGSVAGLRSVDLDHLALALVGEHPRIVSLILNTLDTSQAGEVLKRLPPELRKLVSVQLGVNPSAGADLLPRIADALLRKIEYLGTQKRESSEDAKFKRMADMLRLLEKPDRLELLAVLDQQDPRTAAGVKEYLYQFEDLLAIEDRSVQKILAEADSKTLATALKDAEKTIVDKVLSNLSKRARESIGEEMEFLGSVPGVQVQQARKVLVEIIQRLDQAGELVMKE